MPAESSKRYPPRPIQGDASLERTAPPFSADGSGRCFVSVHAVALRGPIANHALRLDVMRRSAARFDHRCRQNAATTITALSAPARLPIAARVSLASSGSSTSNARVSSRVGRFRPRVGHWWPRTTPVAYGSAISAYATCSVRRPPAACLRRLAQKERSCRHPGRRFGADSDVPLQNRQGARK